MEPSDAADEALDLRAAQLIGEWKLAGWAPTRNALQARRMFAFTAEFFNQRGEDVPVSGDGTPTEVTRACVLALGQATGWHRS